MKDARRTLLYVSLAIYGWYMLIFDGLISLPSNYPYFLFLLLAFIPLLYFTPSTKYKRYLFLKGSEWIAISLILVVIILYLYTTATNDQIGSRYPVGSATTQEDAKNNWEQQQAYDRLRSINEVALALSSLFAALSSYFLIVLHMPKKHNISRIAFFVYVFTFYFLQGFYSVIVFLAYAFRGGVW